MAELGAEASQYGLRRHLGYGLEGATPTAVTQTHISGINEIMGGTLLAVLLQALLLEAARTGPQQGLETMANKITTALTNGFLYPSATFIFSAERERGRGSAD
ncbi:uncharacterized protein [Macrobrachium rosenbergii]|uniref:uncharacterized protein n=1 Tax=Macrobrachium rosenbergii TaxID=79674 RepID=UPI0034D4DA39